MIDNNEDAFDEKLSEVKNWIKQLQKDYPEEELPDALMSSLLGKEIAYNSMKGMYLGYKSGSLVENAVEKSPNDPLVLKIYGDYQWYTPSMFGGDREVALKNYISAKKAYAAAGEIKNSWLYLDLLASLGQAQKAAGQIDSAQKTYQHALQLEPQFSYVSNVLLPALAKK